MLERQLDLLDRESGSNGIDRHPGLDAEARGHREDDLASALRHVALTGEWLAWRESGARGNQRSCSTLGEAEPSSLPGSEHRDREIGISRCERAHVPNEIRVTQQERPRRELPLGERQRLALPPAPEGDHARTGGRCNGCGGVPGAVIRDDDARVREACTERLDRCPDALRLIASGDEDGQSIAHPCCGKGVTGGRMPSVAGSLTP